MTEILNRHIIFRGVILQIDGVPGDDTIEQALAGGSPQRVGWFRFHFADERWEWSDQVQRLHGYEPGTVVPTTSWCCCTSTPTTTFRSLPRWTRVRRTHRTFSTRHRIIDNQQMVHDVIVIGDRLYDDGGDVVRRRRRCDRHAWVLRRCDGHRPCARRTCVNAAVAEIAENRATIEQAKGMLMLIYRISDESAFELLKWRSPGKPTSSFACWPTRCCSTSAS